MSAKESRRITSFNLLTKLHLLQPRSPQASVARVFGGSVFIWSVPESFSPKILSSCLVYSLPFAELHRISTSLFLQSAEATLTHFETTDPSFQATCKILFWLHVCWMEACNISLEPLACYDFLLLPHLNFLSLAIPLRFLLHFTLERILVLVPLLLPELISVPGSNKRSDQESQVLDHLMSP